MAVRAWFSLSPLYLPENYEKIKERERERERNYKTISKHGRLVEGSDVGPQTGSADVTLTSGLGSELDDRREQELLIF